MSDTRQVAILSGCDWYDASVDFVNVPAALDLEAAKADWNTYLREVYEPARKAYLAAPQSQKPKYPRCPTFLGFLKDHGATDWDCETFDTQ